MKKSELSNWTYILCVIARLPKQSQSASMGGAGLYNLSIIIKYRRRSRPLYIQRGIAIATPGKRSPKYQSAYRPNKPKFKFKLVVSC